MATINITVTDTSAGENATTLAALVTATLAGKTFNAGATSTAAKKYLRLGNKVLVMSTATVTNVNFTDTAGNTVNSNVNAVIAAIEAGKTTIRGTKTYVILGGALCDLSTSALPA